MGWLKKHEQTKTEKNYQVLLTQWQNKIDNLDSFIDQAKTFNGETTDDILLASGELLFLAVKSANLIEQKHGAGHYQGTNRGLSIPIGHIDHSTIRYHTGTTRGTYVQGESYDASIDTGTAYITNQRVIFEGVNKTRENCFDKLIGVTNNNDGSSTLSVSNAQKPTTIHYGQKAEALFVFRLSLALAHYKNTLNQLINQLEQTKTETITLKPLDPVKISTSN